MQSTTNHANGLEAEEGDEALNVKLEDSRDNVANKAGDGRDKAVKDAANEGEDGVDEGNKGVAARTSARHIAGDQAQRRTQWGQEQRQGC